MFKVLEKIVGLATAIYERTAVSDVELRRQLRKEKIDWQKAKADIKEYRHKFKLIKIHKKALGQQQGIKTGLFRKRPPYIEENETFGKAYARAKRWLES